VLSGSYDDTLKLWETATGKELRTFTSHTNNIRSVAYSPDGQFVFQNDARADGNCADSNWAQILSNLPFRPIAASSLLLTLEWENFGFWMSPQAERCGDWPPE
jgi:WD40 repeat protein